MRKKQMMGARSSAPSMSAGGSKKMGKTPEKSKKGKGR